MAQKKATTNLFFAKVSRQLQNNLFAVVAGHETTFNLAQHLLRMRSGAFRCADIVVVKEVVDS